jgi:hypothetical protein
LDHAFCDLINSLASLSEWDRLIAALGAYSQIAEETPDQIKIYDDFNDLTTQQLNNFYNNHGFAFGFDDFDDRCYACISKLLLHEMRLPESQVAATRANDDGIVQSEKFVRK